MTDLTKAKWYCVAAAVMTVINLTLAAVQLYSIDINLTCR